MTSETKMVYQTNWKYWPFLFLIDLIGYILFTPFLYLKKLKNIRKILVIRIDEIGDIILATPVFRELKKKFPNAKIGVLIKKGTKELLENNPYVGNIIICEKPWLIGKFNLGYYVKLIKKLKNEKFDLVIELHTDPRNILMAFLIGKYKIGCGYRGLGFLLNKRAKYKEKHTIDTNLDLLRTLSIKSTNNEMDVFYKKKDEKFVTKMLKKYNLKNYIIIHPGVSRKNRLWINERWAKVADKLLNKYKVVFTGSKGEINLVNDIINKMKNKKKKVLNLAGQLTLNQLAVLIKKSKLFIGPNTGASHIARAVNTPSIGLFGSLNPKIWGYNDNNHKSIYKKLDCSFCNQADCIRKKDKYKCMKLIEVRDVLNTIKQIR